MRRGKDQEGDSTPSPDDINNADLGHATRVKMATKEALRARKIRQGNSPKAQEKVEEPKKPKSLVKAQNPVAPTQPSIVSQQAPKRIVPTDTPIESKRITNIDYSKWDKMLDDMSNSDDDEHSNDEEPSLPIAATTTSSASAVHTSNSRAEPSKKIVCDEDKLRNSLLAPMGGVGVNQESTTNKKSNASKSAAPSPPSVKPAASSGKSVDLDDEMDDMFDEISSKSTATTATASDSTSAGGTNSSCAGKPKAAVATSAPPAGSSAKIKELSQQA
jgi:hypothetical protein